MPDAPGISLAALFQSAPTDALRKFVGQHTLRLLEALSTSEVQHQTLVELAVNLAAPSEMLRREDLRRQIVWMLPSVKALELCRTLGLTCSELDAHSILNRVPCDKANLDSLRTFFGVVPERAINLGIPAASVEVAPLYGLYDYQLRLANQALAILADPPHRTLIHMPTGAGKTRTAMHIVAETIKKHPGRRVIWLAQTAELLEQAASEFERAWRSLGDSRIHVHRFWGQYELDTNGLAPGLVVAGLTKLYALLKRDIDQVLTLGDGAALIIIDEAHQALAPTYSRLLDLLQSRRSDSALLGLTATPGRTWANLDEDAKLAGFFQHSKLVLRIPGYDNPVSYLIDQGYLARPEFRTLNAEAGAELSAADLEALSDGLDVPLHVLESLAVDERRNVQIIHTLQELSRNHTRILVFAATVAHAHTLASILRITGIEAHVITGETEQTQRDETIARFKSVHPRPIIICNYGVLTTGFDAPRTSAAVIARPTQSLVLYSQMVGRAIRGRLSGGADAAEIVTIVDPQLPGFGSIAQAFTNWEDVWSNDREH